MHAFIFLVLMTPSSGGGGFGFYPQPHTEGCLKKLPGVGTRGGRGVGSKKRGGS